MEVQIIKNQGEIIKKTNDRYKINICRCYKNI